jgi:hypothetical protein
LVVSGMKRHVPNNSRAKLPEENTEKNINVRLAGTDENIFAMDSSGLIVHYSEQTFDINLYRFQGVNG